MPRPYALASLVATRRLPIFPMMNSAIHGSVLIFSGSLKGKTTTHPAQPDASPTPGHQRAEVPEWDFRPFGVLPCWIRTRIVSSSGPRFPAEFRGLLSRGAWIVHGRGENDRTPAIA